MKIKTLVILLVILAVLAGAGTLIIRMKAPGPLDRRLGSPLLENLPVNKILSIIIKSPGKAVSLVKKTDHWVVENRFDYPADFSKIIGLVRKLKEAKVGRQFEPSEDILKRLSLKDPDDPGAREAEKGIRIHLKGEKNQPFADILLGKTRETGGEAAFPDGHYVILGQGPEIYLIDKHFASFDKEPAAWLNKELVRVKTNDIRKISCLSADGKILLYRFERPQKGKEFQPIIFPTGSKLNPSALNRLAGALSSLRMEDVIHPSTTEKPIDMEIIARFEYQLFDGTLYRVFVGKACSETESCQVKLDVDYHQPAGATNEPIKDESSTKEEAGSEKTPEESAYEAKQLNERLSPWVFIIPKRQHDAFITDLNQLLEKQDNGKAKENG